MLDLLGSITWNCSAGASARIDSIASKRPRRPACPSRLLAILQRITSCPILDDSLLDPYFPSVFSTFGFLRQTEIGVACLVTWHFINMLCH